MPKYIPKSCPSKILDIGRAVRLLRNHPTSSHVPARSPVRRQGNDRPWPDGGDRGRGPDMPESWVQEADGQAVLAAAEVTDLTAELQKLAAAPVFSGIAFEGAIDRLHEKVPFLQPAAGSGTFVATGRLRFACGVLRVDAGAASLDTDHSPHAQEIAVRVAGAPVQRWYKRTFLAAAPEGVLAALPSLLFRPPLFLSPRVCIHMHAYAFSPTTYDREAQPGGGSPRHVAWTTGLVPGPVGFPMAAECACG